MQRLEVLMSRKWNLVSYECLLPVTMSFPQGAVDWLIDIQLNDHLYEDLHHNVESDLNHD